MPSWYFDADLALFRHYSGLGKTVCVKPYMLLFYSDKKF